MKIVIEFLAHRIDSLDAVAIERRCDFTLRQADAVGKRLRGLVARLVFFRSGFQRPAQIIRHRQHVAREVRDRIFRGVLAFLLGAPTNVLAIGQGAQQLVVKRGDFNCRVRLLGDGLRFVIFGRRSSLGGIGRLGVRRFFGFFRFRRFLGLAFILFTHDAIRSDCPTSRLTTFAV